MKTIAFVWVGKLKEPFWRDAAAHYWKSAGRFFRLEETIIKDAPGKLPPDKRTALEGERILAALPASALAIGLDVTGKQYASEPFAALLDKLTEDANRTPTLIIGGPYGLSAPVVARCAMRVSLGAMTLPHELARVVLLEQVYRAGAILHGLPYHHG
ncbi:MAG: 23S rRNA (pseudouridine(1915)-N(3))-methyltransferase RlmH [Desulfovibrionaceae bacterium]